MINLVINILYWRMLELLYSNKYYCYIVIYNDNYCNRNKYIIVIIVLGLCLIVLYIIIISYKIKYISYKINYI